MHARAGTHTHTHTADYIYMGSCILTLLICRLSSRTIVMYVLALEKKKLKIFDIHTKLVESFTCNNMHTHTHTHTRSEDHEDSSQTCPLVWRFWLYTPLFLNCSLMRWKYISATKFEKDSLIEKAINLNI